MATVMSSQGCGMWLAKNILRLIKLTVLKDIGATISPHDAWLINRGLKTLAVRMLKGTVESAQKVAEFLEMRILKSVTVYYPGLPSHPGYKFLRRADERGRWCYCF